MLGNRVCGRCVIIMYVGVLDNHICRVLVNRECVLSVWYSSVWGILAKPCMGVSGKHVCVWCVKVSGYHMCDVGNHVYVVGVSGNPVCV